MKEIHDKFLKIYIEKLKYFKYSNRTIEIYSHYWEKFLRSVNKYHFHLLRHSCFTNLTDQGVDIHAIQKLAGHISSQTTEIYLHMSSKTLNKLPLAL